MADYSTWPTMQRACCMGRPPRGRCCSARNPPSSTPSCATLFLWSTRRSCHRFRAHPARPGKIRPNRPPVRSEPRKIDIDFASGPDRRPMAEHILAVGGARLNVHTIYAKTPPEDTTVTGDQLFATLVDGEVLSSLRGTGHTSLVAVSPNGVKQSSKGDNLLLTFAPPHPRQARGESGQRKTRATYAAAGRAVAVCGTGGKRDPGPGNAGQAGRCHRPAWCGERLL